MDRLIYYAETLVITLRSLGNWFTRDVSITVPVLNIADYTWHMIDIPLPFGYSVAELLIGGGLTLLLGSRLIKFWTDFVN